MRALVPVSRCPGCERFTLLCALCGRLHPLDARACQTKRCAVARTRPIEPHPFHGGVAGGAPLVLASQWGSARPTALEGGGHTPVTTGRFGGMASRYGVLAWWQDEKLWLFGRPRSGKPWPFAPPATFAVPAPLPANGLFPRREGLLLTHGFAHLLHARGVARVPLNLSGRGEPQHLVRRAREELLDAPEAGGAFDFGGVPDAAPTGAGWQPHEVEWLFQAATPTHWLAVGQWHDTLVGVSARGGDALFEASDLALPPGLSPATFRELLVWDDTPAIRTEGTLWRHAKGEWHAEFQVEANGRSLEGAIPDGAALWLWGRTAQGLWARRLEHGGSDGAELSVPMAPNDAVFPFPCVHGTSIAFFRSGTRSVITTLDGARPLDDAREQELPAGAPVVWATGAVFGAAHCLLYATDEGDIVTLWLLAVAPVALAPLSWLRIRPLRDASGRGGTLTLAPCGETFVVNWISAKESRLCAFDLSVPPALSAPATPHA